MQSCDILSFAVLMQPNFKTNTFLIFKNLRENVDLENLLQQSLKALTTAKTTKISEGSSKTYLKANILFIVLFVLESQQWKNKSNFHPKFGLKKDIYQYKLESSGHHAVKNVSCRFQLLENSVLNNEYRTFTNFSHGHREFCLLLPVCGSYFVHIFGARNLRL